MAAVADGLGAGQEGVTDEEIVAAVRSVDAIPEGAAISCEMSARLYSTIWVVTAVNDGTTRRWVVKRTNTESELQARLSARADRIGRELDIHHPTDSHYLPERRLLVSRYYDGRSIGDLMADGGMTRPVAWCREVAASLSLAGQWLRHHHRAEPGCGSVSEPLWRYVDWRRHRLDRLPADTRRKLVRLIESDITGDLAVTHGDFVPANVLCDGRTVCVIDFGILDWIEMSPWWDITTMLVALDRKFLFGRWNLPYWLRPLLSRMKGAFRAGYGDGIAADPEVIRACAAVRHFSFAGELTPELIRSDRRVRWHLARLDEILDGRSLPVVGKAA